MHSLEDGEIRLPNRKARVRCGYTMLGCPVDVVETSRGCERPAHFFFCGRYFLWILAMTT